MISSNPCLWKLYGFTKISKKNSEVFFHPNYLWFWVLKIHFTFLAHCLPIIQQTSFSLSLPSFKMLFSQGGVLGSIKPVVGRWGIELGSFQCYRVINPEQKTNCPFLGSLNTISSAAVLTKVCSPFPLLSSWLPHSNSHSMINDITDYVLTALYRLSTLATL